MCNFSNLIVKMSNISCLNFNFKEFSQSGDFWHFCKLRRTYVQESFFLWIVLKLITRQTLVQKRINNQQTSESVSQFTPKEMMEDAIIIVAISVTCTGKHTETIIWGVILSLRHRNTGRGYLFKSEKILLPICIALEFMWRKDFFLLGTYL